MPPTTVTDVAPVPGAFVVTRLLADPPNVKASDTVPCKTIPAVTSTPWHAFMPAEALPVTLLSDTHAVDSVPLPPNRTHAVASVVAVEMPTIVTLTAPVVAEFETIDWLDVMSLYVTAA